MQAVEGLIYCWTHSPWTSRVLLRTKSSKGMHRKLFLMVLPRNRSPLSCSGVQNYDLATMQPSLGLDQRPFPRCQTLMPWADSKNIILVLSVYPFVCPGLYYMHVHQRFVTRLIFHRPLFCWSRDYFATVYQRVGKFYRCNPNIVNHKQNTAFYCKRTYINEGFSVLLEMEASRCEQIQPGKNTKASKLRFTKTDQGYRIQTVVYAKYLTERDIIISGVCAEFPDPSGYLPLIRQLPFIFTQTQKLHLSKH